MGKSPIRRAAALAAGLALAATASAHDTWLAVKPGRLTPGAVLRAAMTSGGAFPEPESPIDPRRIARAEALLGGGALALSAGKPGRRALELSVPVERGGVATLAVSLAPRTLVLEPSLIAEYLEEIGASETAGAEWARRPEPKQWRETYTKHAKTHSRIGEASGDDSWSRPAGLRLEIVAEKDPTRLTAGDSLPVRVLRNGAPLPGFSLRADPGRGGKVARRPTDADGHAAFVLDRAGPWLLAGTDLRWDAGKKLWRSDFTTLTVDVAPAPPR
jgi:uncharacterized GH25 family protein